MSASDHWHREFRIANVGRRLLAMPLFVALIPFIGGILLAECVVLPLWLTITMGALFMGVAWWLRAHTSALIYAAVAMLMIGYSIVEWRDTDADIPYEHDMEMVIRVESMPAEREGYRVAEGSIMAWNNERWHSGNERVQLWLRNDSIMAGDEVRLYGKVVERMSRYEDYNALLRRRGFVGGVGINDHNTLCVKHGEVSSLQNRAIEKLGGSHIDNQAHATMVAMVTGSRHSIDTTLRNEYSQTGLSHLMAVSGLHLGIVLIIINILFAPLSLIHRGHRLRTPLVLVALWLYVAVSGASPSVIRAATMLSAIQVAWASSSHYNTVNILSLTIIAMLAYNPNYLFDISFQLSVVAVMGIVLWGVPMMRSMPAAHGASGYLIGSVIVGIAATLWTLPIISHSFGNIPIIGVLITPFAIITAYIILGCGIFALLLPTALGVPFAYVAEGSALVQNEMVARAATWEFASIDYTLSGDMVAIYYTIFIAITLIGWAYERKKVITLQKNDDI